MALLLNGFPNLKSKDYEEALGLGPVIGKINPLRIDLLELIACPYNLFF